MRKIPTMFVRDEADRRYVTREVTPGCEWVLAGEGVATRKWDGTCVWIDRDGLVWARREVKPGKGMPSGFREVEHDETTGKRVGWEPWHQSSFAKLIDEAHADADGVGPGTYELVGPKINGNPDGYESHTLVPHGWLTVDLADRSWEGIRAWTIAHPEAEGIVFWRVPGELSCGLAKIKRRDFARSAASVGYGSQESKQ